MKKCMVREKVVSNTIERIKNELSITPDDVAGKNYFLKEICEEVLSEAELCHERERFLKAGGSEEFCWVYMVDPEFGIKIDSHIHIFHFREDYSQHEQKLFGWQYPDSIMYFGDSWWFEDEEILHDILHLSIIELLKKYKGY